MERLGRFGGLFSPEKVGTVMINQSHQENTRCLSIQGLRLSAQVQ